MRRRIVLLLMAAMVALLVAAQPAFADGYPPPPKKVCPTGDEPGNPNEIADTGTDKQRICHRTGSESNPYVVINVSDQAAGHNTNHKDNILPGDFCADPVEACPTLPYA